MTSERKYFKMCLTYFATPFNEAFRVIGFIQDIKVLILYFPIWGHWIPWGKGKSKNVKEHLHEGEKREKSRINQPHVRKFDTWFICGKRNIFLLSSCLLDLATFLLQLNLDSKIKKVTFQLALLVFYAMLLECELSDFCWDFLDMVSRWWHLS